MNPARVASQMETLHEEFFRQSAAGEMKGKETYPDRLLPSAGWLNAHHVQNVTVHEMEAGCKLKITAAHTWEMTDDPNERFARIKDMQVKQLEALGED